MRCFVTGFILAAVLIPASAAIVTVSFQGAISTSPNPSIPIGTPFAGGFTYDSDTLPNFTGIDFGSYSLSAGSLTVTILGTSVMTTPITLLNVVENFGGNLGLTFSVTPPSDHFSIGGGAGSPDGPLAGIQSVMVLFASSNAALFNGTGLPGSFPSIRSFSGAELILGFPTGFVAGPLDTGAEVPEPKSLGFVAAGIAGVALTRRFRN